MAIAIALLNVELCLKVKDLSSAKAENVQLQLWSTIQQEIYAKLILGFSLPDMSGADSSFFWEVNRLNLQSQAQPTMEQKASWTNIA